MPDAFGGDPPLLLITGATGAVGPAVVRAALDAGYCVRTLSSRPPPADLFAASSRLDLRVGDVTSARDVRAVCQGVDGVIHLAALLHRVNPPAALDDVYYRTNVESTRMLVAEAVAAGARRLVFFSTIAVYGDTHGQVVTEETPPAPQTTYARTKMLAEHDVLQARRPDHHPFATVLRMAAIYGARVKGNYRRLLDAIARRRFVHLGPGTHRRTLVHDQDAAAAALLALQHDRAPGRVFNVSDGAFHTFNEIVEAIARALDVPVPRWRMPLAPVRVVARAVETVTERVGWTPPLSRHALSKLTEDLAVDSSLIQRELGFEPRVDLIAGWTQTVRELRTRGAVS